MFDSDDDFPDDFVLDDQTLAVLDEEESRFKRAAQPTAEDPLPPAKRRKLDPGHPLNFGVFSHSTADDTEDLPDITVRSDGTYGVELQGPVALAPQAALNGNMRSRGENVTKDAAITSNNPILADGNSTPRAPPQRPSQSRHPAPTTRPARAPSARVASQPLRSQSTSRPPAADPSPAAVFDAQLADMRRQTNEV
ncbi:hypothetical protein DFH29DRAFT_203212 [Suillus ampliporus]|nr:hypothetical protein DFH29DRAFT_203212 [Suillus ampliporus]